MWHYFKIDHEFLQIWHLATEHGKAKACLEESVCLLNTVSNVS